MLLNYSKSGEPERWPAGSDGPAVSSLRLWPPGSSFGPSTPASWALTRQPHEKSVRAAWGWAFTWEETRTRPLGQLVSILQTLDTIKTIVQLVCSMFDFLLDLSALCYMFQHHGQRRSNVHLKRRSAALSVVLTGLGTLVEEFMEFMVL